MKTPLFAIFIVILILTSCSNIDTRFNREIWLSEESQKPDPETLVTKRQYMVDDLVKNHLPNKTKTDVLDLLGNGLETGYFFSTGRDLIYILGPEQGYLGMDSEWLLIWFDENDIFLKYQIATD